MCLSASEERISELEIVRKYTDWKRQKNIYDIEKNPRYMSMRRSKKI